MAHSFGSILYAVQRAVEADRVLGSSLGAGWGLSNWSLHWSSNAWMTVKELNWFLGGYAFFIIREKVKALILRNLEAQHMNKRKKKLFYLVQTLYFWGM